MKPQTVKFIFVGNTKNKYRYEEEKNDHQVVGALYISQEAGTAEPPKELIVTITPVTA